MIRWTEADVPPLEHAAAVTAKASTVNGSAARRLSDLRTLRGIPGSLIGALPLSGQRTGRDAVRMAACGDLIRGLWHVTELLVKHD